MNWKLNKIFVSRYPDAYDYEDSNAITKGNKNILSIDSDQVVIKNPRNLGEINFYKPHEYKSRRKRDWQTWRVGSFKDTPSSSSGKNILYKIFI